MKTIDLDLAEELQSLCKEKNITMPESELVWMPYKDIVVGRKGTHRHYFNPAFISENYRDLIKDDWHKAYTLDELLEWIKTANRWVSVEWNVSDKDWVAWCENKAREDIYKYNTNPANAACKLLIHLIKKGWI